VRQAHPLSVKLLGDEVGVDDEDARSLPLLLEALGGDLDGGAVPLVPVEEDEFPGPVAVEAPAHVHRERDQGLGPERDGSPEAHVEGGDAEGAKIHQEAPREGGHAARQGLGGVVVRPEGEVAAVLLDAAEGEDGEPGLVEDPLGLGVGHLHEASGFLHRKSPG